MFKFSIATTIPNIIVHYCQLFSEVYVHRVIFNGVYDEWQVVGGQSFNHQERGGPRRAVSQSRVYKMNS